MSPIRLPKAFSFLRRPVKKKQLTKRPFGKERELQKQVKEMVDKKREDTWKRKGTIERYSEIFESRLNSDPIDFLIKKENKNPEILIGGAARGEYIVPLRKELIERGLHPEIDVFNISPTNGTANQIIRRDLSIGQALETISSKPKEYSSQINKLKERFDLAIFASGAGMHTLYPAFNVFNAALMLKKGGRAYIEIPTQRFLEIQSIKNKETYPSSQVKRIQKQISEIDKVVLRMLSAYSKRDVSNEYEIKKLLRSKTRNGIFIRIERK